jgi:hypothetical protein
MKKIPLTGKNGQGKFALVDDEDYEWLRLKLWNLDAYGYAVSSIKVNGKRKGILMHRWIMNTPADKDTHHRDHNKLNNQKPNLVICSTAENNRHVGVPKHNTSGLKGVSWHKTNQDWHACIRVNGKLVHLGGFKDLIEAAVAYDQASIEFHGEFGVRNFL